MFCVDFDWWCRYDFGGKKKIRCFVFILNWSEVKTAWDFLFLFCILCKTFIQSNLCFLSLHTFTLYIHSCQTDDFLYICTYIFLFFFFLCYVFYENHSTWSTPRQTVCQFTNWSPYEKRKNEWEQVNWHWKCAIYYKSKKKLKKAAILQKQVWRFIFCVHTNTFSLYLGLCLMKMTLWLQNMHLTTIELSKFSLYKVFFFSCFLLCCRLW